MRWRGAAAALPFSTTCPALWFPAPAAQVAKEIWVCEKKTVKPWTGNIREYKKSLARKM